MLGNKEDKEQEPVEEQIIGLDLNIELATITFLTYQRAIEETEEGLKYFKGLRHEPIENRPKELQEPETLNENIQLSIYTLSKLRYLLGEVRMIMIELAPPEDNQPKLIKSPKWGK